jgi:hypothetical protein
MSWSDLGLIYAVLNLSGWQASHAYVPTALAMTDRIRVFVAFWGHDRIGRLGFIDVALDDPRRILGVSDRPVLQPGAADGFDQDGVTPMTVVRIGAELRLYYAGWQRRTSSTIRYTLFTGLAISNDATRFERVSALPVIGPGAGSTVVRTCGAILPISNGWRCYLAEDVGQIELDGKSTPSYRLSTMISPDGVHWPALGEEVFPVSEAIFGYGRSAVWRTDSGYQGLFSVRRRDSGYQAIEYSTSMDGVRWSPPSRTGMAFCADQTRDGQQQVCFPSLVFQGDRILMFYNGDDFGRAGLRAAIWHS